MISAALRIGRTPARPSEAAIRRFTCLVRIEALGGTGEIESPPGGGTSIAVTLPLDTEPTQQ
jgi:hypothetical protein